MSPHVHTSLNVRITLLDARLFYEYPYPARESTERGAYECSEQLLSQKRPLRDCGATSFQLKLLTNYTKIIMKTVMHLCLAALTVELMRELASHRLPSRQPNHVPLEHQRFAATASSNLVNLLDLQISNAN